MNRNNCHKSYSCNLLKQINADNVACLLIQHLSMQRSLHTRAVINPFHYFSRFFVSSSPRTNTHDWLTDDARYLSIKSPVLELYMYEVNVERAWCCLCQERELADSAAHPNPGAEFGARIGHVLLQVPKVCRCVVKLGYLIARLVHYFERTICTPVHACGTLVAIPLTFNCLPPPVLRTILRVMSPLIAWKTKKRERVKWSLQTRRGSCDGHEKVGSRWMTRESPLITRERQRQTTSTV